VLSIVAAVLLLFLVLSRVEWDDFIALVQRADQRRLGLVFLFLFADRLFMAWKWSVLLRGLAVSIPLRHVVAYYYLGNLMGTAIQWQVGGDIARASVVGHDTGKAKAVFASVVIERLGGVAAAGVLAMGSLVLLNHRLGFAPHGPLIVAAGVGATIMAFLPFLLTSKRAVRVVLFLGSKITFRPIQNALRGLVDFGGDHKGFSLSLAVFFVATLVEQLVPPVSMRLISSAFAIPISFTDALMVMPLISFLSRLPVSLESIGVREALFVFFLGLIGISTTEAFTLAIVVRCIDLLMAGSGGGRRGLASAA